MAWVLDDTSTLHDSLLAEFNDEVYSSGADGVILAPKAEATLLALDAEVFRAEVLAETATAMASGLDATSVINWVSAPAGVSTAAGLEPQVLGRIGHIVSGTSGAYYPVFVGTNGATFSHNPGAAGCINIMKSSSSYINITYPSCSGTADDATYFGGAVTSGISISTRVRLKADGVYLISHTITSTFDTRLLIDARMKSPNSTTVGTVNGQPSVGTTYTDGLPFRGAYVKSSEGDSCYLIPGNGYENDYTSYNYAVVGKSNTQVCNALRSDTTGNSYAYIVYGFTGATEKGLLFTANTPRTYEYVVAVAPTIASTKDNARRLYEAYHDAFSPYDRPDAYKLVWSTGHQLICRKSVDDNYAWATPGVQYGYLMYPTDAVLMALGIGGEYPGLINNTFTHLGTSGAYLGLPTPNTVMDSSAPWNSEILIAASVVMNGHVPTTEEINYCVAKATSWTTTLNYANRMFQMHGRFEANVYQYESDDNVVAILTDELDAGATALIRPTEGGVSPYDGSYMHRQTGVASGQALTYTEKMHMHPGVSLTLDCQVNIPATFTGENGVKFGFRFYDAYDELISSSESSLIQSTTGWDAQTHVVTTPASTSHVRAYWRTYGAGTAYFDDVNPHETSPNGNSYWIVDMRTSPDALKPDGMDANGALTGEFAVNLAAMKVIIPEAQWTQDFEDCLQAWKKGYVENFFTDDGHYRKFSRYSLDRSTWTHIITFMEDFFHMIFAGSAMLSDEQIATLYQYYPSYSAGLSYGNVCFRGHLIRQNGTFIGGQEYWIQGGEGNYQDGASWMAFDCILHLLAHKAGVPGAFDNLENRLKVEQEISSTSYATYEYINGAYPYTAVTPGYGWNAVAVYTSITPIQPNSVVAVLQYPDLSLSWVDGSFNELAFNVERNIDGAGWSALVSNSANDNTLIDTTLPAEWTTVRYRVNSSNSDGTSDWVESNLVYSVITIDLTHTLSANVKETFTSTNSVSGSVRDTFVRTSSLDAVIKQELTASNGIDSVVKEIQTASHAVDSVVLETKTTNNTVDAGIFAQYTFSSVLDSVVKVIESLTTSLDAVVCETFSLGNTNDGIVKAISSASNSVDAIVRTTNDITSDVSTVVLETLSTTSSVDSIILVTSEVSGTIEAAVKETTDVSCSVGGYVLDGKVAICSIDGVVRGTAQVSVSVDAVVKESFAISTDVLGDVMVHEEVSTEVDAVVRVTNQQSYLVDGVVKVVSELGTALSTIVLAEYGITHGLIATVVPTVQVRPRKSTTELTVNEMNCELNLTVKQYDE